MGSYLLSVLMRREVFTGGGYRSNFWNGVIDWAW